MLEDDAGPPDNDAVRAALATLRQDSGGGQPVPAKRGQRRSALASQQQQGGPEGGGPSGPSQQQGGGAAVSNYVEKMKGAFATALSTSAYAADLPFNLPQAPY